MRGFLFCPVRQPSNKFVQLFLDQARSLPTASGTRPDCRPVLHTSRRKRTRVLRNASRLIAEISQDGTPALIRRFCESACGKSYLSDGTKTEERETGRKERKGNKKCVPGRISVGLTLQVFTGHQCRPTRKQKIVLLNAGGVMSCGNSRPSMLSALCRRDRERRTGNLDRSTDYLLVTELPTSRQTVSPLQSANESSFANNPNHFPLDFALRF